MPCSSTVSRSTPSTSGCALFGHEAREQHLAGRVVDERDEVLQRAVLALEPMVLAAVEVQHHARHRLALAPPPIRFAFLPTSHEARVVQQRLGPAVAHLDLVLPELLPEVLHVEPGVFAPVQLEHPRHRRLGHTILGCLALPVVTQAAHSVRLVPSLPSAHLPVRHAEDPCCIQPTNFLPHRLPNHFAYLHRPLRGGQVPEPSSPHRTTVPESCLAGKPDICLVA